MPRLRIAHTTRYQYSAPVGLTAHRLMLRPQDSHDLRLHAATLTVDPAPQTTRWAHDVFGNSICHLEWDPDLQADHLRIVSELELTHYPAGALLPQATLDPAAEAFPFSYASDEVPDLARLAERQVPDPGRTVDAWVHRFLGERPQTLDLLQAITHAVKSDFAYEAREAEGTQAPAETLEKQRGTCRDFALLMMEAARSLGLAARFVTGYLYSPARDGNHRGGGATHAWCQVYLPGAGWVEFDPTNGIIGTRDLIRVGVAREPRQAIPIAGTFIGAKDDYLGMDVEVVVERVVSLQDGMG